jgi:hypothetical protein
MTRKIEDYLREEKIVDELSNLPMSSLYYAMAEASHHAGEYAKAWEYLTTANNIEKQKRKQYDFEKMYKMNNLITEVFNKDYFPKSRDKIGSSSMFPIFIVGMSENTDTVDNLVNLLDHHSQIFAMSNDMKYFNDLWGKTFPNIRYSVFQEHVNEIRNVLVQEMNPSHGGWESARGSLDKISKDVLRDMNILMQYSKQNLMNNIRYYVDVNLFHYRYIGFIHLLFPKAIIINIARDPLDNILDCYRNKKSVDKDREWSIDISTVVNEYIEYQRMITHWKIVLPKNRIIEINYELLRKNPEKALKQVFNKLNLKWEYGMDSDLAMIDSYGSTGDWTHYHKYLKPFIPKLSAAMEENNRRYKLPYDNEINWNMKLEYYSTIGTRSNSNKVGNSERIIDEYYEDEADDDEYYEDEDEADDEKYYEDADEADDDEYYEDADEADDDEYYEDDDEADDDEYYEDDDEADDDEYYEDEDEADDDEYYEDADEADDDEYYEDEAEADDDEYYEDEDEADDDEYYEAEADDDEYYEDADEADDDEYYEDEAEADDDEYYEDEDEADDDEYYEAEADDDEYYEDADEADDEEYYEDEAEADDDEYYEDADEADDDEYYEDEAEADDDEYYEDDDEAEADDDEYYEADADEADDDEYYEDEAEADDDEYYEDESNADDDEYYEDDDEAEADDDEYYEDDDEAEADDDEYYEDDDEAEADDDEYYEDEDEAEADDDEYYEDDDEADADDDEYYEDDDEAEADDDEYYEDAEGDTDDAEYDQDDDEGDYMDIKSSSKSNRKNVQKSSNSKSSSTGIKNRLSRSRDFTRNRKESSTSKKR